MKKSAAAIAPPRPEKKAPRGARPPRAEPPARRHEADAGGEREQERLPHEPELRHGEVELGLEGGEADEQGADQAHVAGVRERAALALAVLRRLAALDVEDPLAQDRERRAADQQQVGRAPQ